jgi:hypothetical protein
MGFVFLLIILVPAVCGTDYFVRLNNSCEDKYERHSNKHGDGHFPGAMAVGLR